MNSVIYDGELRLLEECQDYESFYQAFITNIQQYIELLAKQEKQEYEICAAEAPFLYYSILFDDCMQRGKPIFDGGIRYLGGTLECYGSINTSDALIAIKTLVYEKKLILPRQLIDALKNNFVGYEKIRRLLLSCPKYGNDDDEADLVAIRLHNDICQIARRSGEKVSLHTYQIVIINNSMNSVFGLTTKASADGRLANTYMANANNPTGGMDRNGLTAMLNSLVKIRTDIHAGSVQNMRFSKEMFHTLGDKTKQLLKVYFRNGGSQAMITVLNQDDLENAMNCPEMYQNLVVRVGGFSARFVELPKEVQRELMSRTLYD